MDLKAISCRIEWSLFQVHSTKHARVIQLVSSCKYGINAGPVRIRIYRAFFLCYPLPSVKDVFAMLAGGKSFTKLDLAHAYSQIPLSKASKQYVTINTHKGLYRYNRLPFGITAAPSIF